MGPSFMGPLLYIHMGQLLLYVHMDLCMHVGRLEHPDRPGGGGKVRGE